jgi:hypothetical protein
MKSLFHLDNMPEPLSVVEFLTTNGLLMVKPLAIVDIEHPETVLN